MTKNISIKLFSLIFGVFSMGFNAAVIIIPMRLLDQGLSYDKIGIAMSMMGFGMLVIKPVIGRHADSVGAKKYVLVSLIIGAVALCMMSFNSSPVIYIILNCILGLCRGMFTSITSFYTVVISDKKNLGNSFGNFVGISTLFTCLGGVLAGVLYPLYYGTFALMLVAITYVAAVFITFKWLPDTKTDRTEKKKKESFYYLFKTMNAQVYIFGLIVFLQQFTTGPLWNTFIPLHFYSVFAVSSALVGILMSLDELIGSPTSFVAGKIADKISDRSFLVLGYFFAGVFAFVLTFAKTPLAFMCFFLTCGIFVTCTQVVIPKSASGFMRKNNRAFEFAFISSCGGLGEWLGNMILGDVMKNFTVNYIVLIFVVSYMILSIVSFCTLGHKEIYNK